MYRCEYFVDAEKAYKYQQQINNLESETHIYWSITNSTIALEYENKGEYDKAIEFYKKAYDNKESDYDDVWYSIASVYIKTGDTEQAAKYLKRILTVDKKKLECAKDYCWYSSHICYELIKLLVSQKHYDEAKPYIQELIYYNEPLVSDDYDMYYIKFIIFANYQLYKIEQDSVQKEHFWNECTKYYSIVEADEDVENEIFDFVIDFIIEYIKNIDIYDKMFDKIIFILKHLNIWQTGNKQKELLEYAINICNDNKKYRKWHLIFLMKYAEILCNIHYKNYSEAFCYCSLAQDLYDKYDLQDSYCQNLIYKTMAECMSNINKYNFDEVNTLRKKCNYALLAQKNAKPVWSSCKDAIEIWQDAAQSYEYIDFYRHEIFCLQKALSIITPILDQYNYSDYNKYQEIAKDLIIASLNLEDHSGTYNIIKTVYNNTLNYYKNKNFGKYWSSDISQLANYCEKLHLFQEAIDMYLYAMYVLVCDRPDIHLIDKITLHETKRNKLYKDINKIVRSNINNNIIDDLIDLKDDILLLSDKIKIDCNYMDLLQYISEKYQYSEIEFKK